jgi:Protein of unknown function (DUF1615)
MIHEKLHHIRQFQQTSLLSALLVVLATILAQPAYSVPLTTAQTTKLIRRAQPALRDANGWALDLHDVLQQHELGTERETVCASLAIIDQESNFKADPEVAGLGKLSENALQEKLGRIPLGGRFALAWLEKTPSPDASFMDRIRSARTERDLDLAYRGLVTHFGETSNLDVVLQLGVLNKLIEERNEIDTAGSMQVSVKFALDETREKRWLPLSLSDVYAVRDQLYTRRGGMYFGVKQLLGYDTGYGQKIYRFADYNAGRYASRNAAFQQSVVQLSGEKLALDGDLLSYGKDGKPLSKITSTEKAIRLASKRHKLELTDNQIRADLLREKQLGFTGTRTFLAIRDLAQVTAGKVVAFAMVPDIALDSPKLRSKFTTRRFAESVNKRYRACMAAKL